MKDPAARRGSIAIDRGVSRTRSGPSRTLMTAALWSEHMLAAPTRAPAVAASGDDRRHLRVPVASRLSSSCPPAPTLTT
jgi:hypothetical protein